ncbi:MAG: hypothetical protein ABW221_19190 [Vicinamibacteria bacterium]
MRTLVSFVLVTAACAPAERAAPPPASTQPPAPTTPPRAESWLGEWKGVEGTFLRLERKGPGYAVTIANLDGPRTFDATGAGDTVTFTRDGKSETIRATDGAGTGMKWLADRKDCLVVTAGSEGFCR